MDTLTATLKAYIAYERRNNLTNLLNHKEEDLLKVVEDIEHHMREMNVEIKVKEKLLEESEDLAEKVRDNLVSSIAFLRNEVQARIAWRAIFFAAIKEVKQ